MNGKNIGTAVFVRKARTIEDLVEARERSKINYVKGKIYIIEKEIEVEPMEFENIATDLVADRDYIRENLLLMQEDKNQSLHCILVKPKGAGLDGILIQAEGYEYPRYAAVVGNPMEFIKE